MRRGSLPWGFQEGWLLRRAAERRAFGRTARLPKPKASSVIGVQFNALSDFTRPRVVRLLAAEGEGLFAKEIAIALEVKQSQLSHHLRVLFQSGMVRMERNGVRVKVSLEAESEEAMALATAVLSCSADREIFGEDLKRRLLQSADHGASD
jgi:DNA-binding transcriptional ArsR family regulator